MRYSFIIPVLLCGAMSLQAQSKHIKFTSNKKAPVNLEHIESWFTYVPSTTYKAEDERTISAKGFFMMRFETPNMLYRLFVNDLKASGKLVELEKALPDTNSWFSGLDPYKEYYFRHPAYDKFPVVQVSREGVKLFCDWLNEKIKTVSLKTWKNKKVTFRLPTEIEWMVAAAGDNPEAIYAWKGNYLRNRDAYGKKNLGGFTGDYHANFCTINDNQVARNEKGELMITDESRNQMTGGLMDNVFITAPVLSYWENGYGLFNMCGNVREMVQEEGFTKGGGWIDPGADLRIVARNTFQKEGFPCEGFRLVAEVE